MRNYKRSRETCHEKAQRALSAVHARQGGGRQWPHRGYSYGKFCDTGLGNRQSIFDCKDYHLTAERPE